MSRYSKRTGNVEIVRGNDHAVGNFVQVLDDRYAASGKDEQGEGFVMDWDEVFGFSINLIGAVSENLNKDEKLIELAEQHAKTYWDDIIKE